MLLLQRRKKGTSDCKLRKFFRGLSSVKPGNSYLDLPDKHRVEWPIPPCRELHGWRVSLLVLDEADPNNILLFVLKEETNSLESTGVTGPAARTRYTPRETFCLVPVRHTARKLQLRMVRSIPIGPSRGGFITPSWIACTIDT